MQIGMIGLGKMGSNMSRRLMKAGHHCVAFRRQRHAPRSAGEEGATAVGSLAEVVKTLGEKPRAVWLMLPPAGSPKRRLGHLGVLLEPDDHLSSDGGNSFYKDDIRRAKKVGEKGICYASIVARPAASGVSSVAIA